MKKEIWDTYWGPIEDFCNNDLEECEKFFVQFLTNEQEEKEEVFLTNLYNNFMEWFRIASQNHNQEQIKIVLDHILNQAQSYRKNMNGNIFNFFFH